MFGSGLPVSIKTIPMIPMMAEKTRKAMAAGLCAVAPGAIDQDCARAAFRDHYSPGYRGNILGFRVVCSSPII